MRGFIYLFIFLEMRMHDPET